MALFGNGLKQVTVTGGSISGSSFNQQFMQNSSLGNVNNTTNFATFGDNLVSSFNQQPPLIFSNEAYLATTPSATDLSSQHSDMGNVLNNFHSSFTTGLSVFSSVPSKSLNYFGEIDSTNMSYTLPNSNGDDGLSSNVTKSGLDDLFGQFKL